MSVYFVQTPTTGSIKIGFSSNPRARLLDLQVGSPLGLRLLAVCDGERGLEQELHSYFKDCRQAGEWFRPVPRLLQFVKDVAEGAFSPADLIAARARAISTIDEIAAAMTGEWSWNCVRRAIEIYGGMELLLSDAKLKRSTTLEHLPLTALVTMMRRNPYAFRFLVTGWCLLLNCHLFYREQAINQASEFLRRLEAEYRLPSGRLDSELIEQ